MKKIIFFLFLIIYSNNLLAANFYIKNYDVDIKVNPNSVLEIKENLLVHFYQPRHGIKRFIPYKYRVETKTENMKNLFIYGNKYKAYIFDIETPGVKNKIYKKGAYLNIRMGDPDKYVNGDVNYTIKYKVYGTIAFFQDYAEFYYNVIGTKWDTKIDKATFSIHLPQNYLPAQDKYYVVRGKFGSTEKVPLVRADAGILYGETSRPLNPFEGITVAIWFPKDFLSQGSLGLNLKLFFLNNYSYFIPFLVFAFWYLLWLKFGKDKKIVKMVHFKPPAGLTPAEVGYLIDDKGDNRDLISLIFYWASQGLIDIEEVEGKTLLDPKRDYILYKNKDLPETAKDFEKTIFYDLFPGSSNVVKTSSLKNNFYKTILKASKELTSKLIQNDAYERKSILLSSLAKISAFILLFAGIILAFTQEDIVIFISLFFSAIITFFFGKYLPKKTASGTKQYEQIVGFKEFIERAEKPKLELLLKEDPNYFDKILPYALALGITKKVAEKFKDLVTRPPEWFRGHYTGYYTPILLAEKMDDSFKTISRDLTSAPQTSSGSSFSGGGSSVGGGFGGGGGSDW
ncbi:MAG: hypothetical protein PWR24_1363 [Desulfonauticus sp.]|nr:hypothetical protein [Desulfonauticus sp.]